MHSWPAWLGELSPEMPSILSFIDRYRDALRLEATEGFVYRRLAQAQIRQLDDQGQKAGAFKWYPDGKKTDFAALKLMQPPQNLLRAAVFNISQRHQTLKAFRFAKKVLLQDLLEGIRGSMKAGSLFTGFAAMKALLEAVGEMDQLSSALNGVKPGSDARRAGELYDEVINREFASEIDWNSMPKSDIRQTADPRSLRAEPDSKRDEELRTQRGISGLGKRIKGVPASYAMLSEFARPRVGTLWLVYEESRSMLDGHKTQWNRNKLGPGFPSTMVEQMGSIIAQLFGVLNEVLDLQQKIDRELAELDERISRYTQDETRTWLWHFPDLFDKHEDCPCGSGKRVKYCCQQ